MGFHLAARPDWTNRHCQRVTLGRHPARPLSLPDTSRTFARTYGHNSSVLFARGVARARIVAAAASPPCRVLIHNYAVFTGLISFTLLFFCLCLSFHDEEIRSKLGARLVLYSGVAEGSSKVPEISNASKVIKIQMVANRCDPGAKRFVDQMSVVL